MLLRACLYARSSTPCIMNCCRVISAAVNCHFSNAIDSFLFNMASLHLLLPCSQTSNKQSIYVYTCTSPMDQPSHAPACCLVRPALGTAVESSLQHAHQTAMYGRAKRRRVLRTEEVRFLQNGKKICLRICGQESTTTCGHASGDNAQSCSIPGERIVCE